jgi:PAS domain-containing protein
VSWCSGRTDGWRWSTGPIIGLTAGLTTRPGDSLDDLLRQRIAQGEYGPGDPEVLLALHLAYDTSRPQTRRRRRPNGAILENRWVPLADGAFMIVCTDITPLVGAEQAVARRGAETDILVGGLRHGLILWAPDQRLLLANPMAATLLGLPPEMLSPGRPFVELIDATLAGGFLGSGPLAQAIAAEIKARATGRVPGCAISSTRPAASSSVAPIRSPAA